MCQDLKLLKSGVKMPLASGIRIGPYEIVDLLGSGGMGEVYRARDTRLNRIVAIKVLPPQIASDVEGRQRFDREALTIAARDRALCSVHYAGN